MTTPQQFLIYQSEDGATRIDVMLEAEALWLSQKQLTELFGKAKGTISEHIKHIFEDVKLEQDSVVRLFRTTAADGKQYEVAHARFCKALARCRPNWPKPTPSKSSTGFGCSMTSASNRTLTAC